MTCQKAGELLSAYIDGELVARQSAALETHLTGCDGCREELATLKNAIALLEAPRAFARPEGLLEEFKEKYLPAVESEPAPRWGFRLPALPQFEWPSMGRVLLPMGGMAAAAAALMVALQTQQLPNPAVPAAPSVRHEIASTSGTSPASDTLAGIAMSQPARTAPGTSLRPAPKEEKAAVGRRDGAVAPPGTAPRTAPPRPAGKVMPPRANRRPPVYLADAEAPELRLRVRRPARPMPLKPYVPYAAATPAAPVMDERAMAKVARGRGEATPTLEDQWKSVAAVTLRRSTETAASVTVEEGYAEVSCRNVKTGDVSRVAFGAPVAGSTPTAAAVSGPAEASEPAADTGDTE